MIINIAFSLTIVNAAASGYLSSGPCKLKLWEAEDYDQWHDIVQGFLYGMYYRPPSLVTNCDLCDSIAKNIGAIQMVISDLELSRYQWVDINYINNKPFFDKVQLLMGLYIKFYALGFNIDKIWKSNIILAMIYKLNQKLNSDYFKEVEKNVSENWYNATILLMDIPGKTCESVGTRIGVTFRRITGISLDVNDI